jgi:hypothetical protein
MAVAVRLSDEIVRDAQKYASLSLRSVPKQIEYWYRLGKMADENPDLPLDFIKGVLEGKQEMEQGDVSAFSFRTAAKTAAPRSKTAAPRKPVAKNRKTT